jgi:NAD(P)-dependent dehydrogenase (short-subunit alcohol dehydrogenase family)
LKEVLSVALKNRPLFRVNSIANTSAYQLRQTDIRVNSICPGLIETGMTEGTFEYARRRGSASKIGQLNALGRYAVAEGTPLALLSLCIIKLFLLLQKLPM